MTNWKNVTSHSRTEQAALRIDLLKKNGIDAVMLKGQDSAFLLGDIEIMVKEEDYDRASELLHEFDGWARILVFSRIQPVERLKNEMEAQGMETLLLRKHDHDDYLETFELYVAKDNETQAKEWMKQPPGWKVLVTLTHPRQAALRSEVLENKNIDVLVTKTRDEQGQVKQVQVLCPEKQAEEAWNILKNKEGWQQLLAGLSPGELHEKLAILDEEAVNYWLEPEQNPEKVYVRKKYWQQVQEWLRIKVDWVSLKTYATQAAAQYDQSILKDMGIEAHVLNQKDSMFLLGGYELYVEKRHRQASLNALKSN